MVSPRGLTPWSVITDGVGYLDTSSIYYQYDTEAIDGYLVLCYGGNVYTAALELTGIPPLFAAQVLAITGNGLVAGSRMRMIPFGSEMVMVQDGATQVYYINPDTGSGGTLGIPDPTVVPTVVAGTGTLAPGTYLYAYTYVDYLGRESDLSLPTSYTAVTGSDGPSITVPGMSNSDQYALAKIYRTKVNTAIPFFFLIGVSYASPTYSNDSMTDATIGGNPQASAPGQNAPPLVGNQIAVWRNRLWMNVSTQPYLIQCSNNGSASQWSALTIIGTSPATDGEVIRVQSSNSDFVVGFCPLSSILLVFKRYSIYTVMGFDVTNFTVQELKPAGRGCIAPDTIKNCDDVCIFLGATGVYSIDASGNLTKISKNASAAYGGIEAAIYALYTTALGMGTLQNAVAWYVDRIYYLSIGTTVYAYNVDTGAWTQSVYSNFLPSAQINTAFVMLCSLIPPLALVGLTAAPPYGVFCLDNYNTGQNITNLVLTSRCLQDRSTTKRVNRLRIFGRAAAIAGGTLTCYFDNANEPYMLNTASLAIPQEAARGALIYQEFTAYAQGRLVYFTLNLSATDAYLSSWEVEYTVEQ